MDDILQDLSVSALVDAIDAGTFGLIPYWRRCPLLEVHIDPGLAWALTDIPFPPFNSILRARLEPEAVDAAIETIIARGRSKHVPLLWYIGPTTRPTDLGKHLAAHGFIHQGDTPGMAVDLLALHPPPSHLSGLIITQVQDGEAMKTWCRVSSAGFELPDFAKSGWQDLFTSVGFGPESPQHHYLGWWKGEPVATSTLLCSAGVGGIYNVSTVPSARRQGIGTAMTLAPLYDARELGYRVGILHASPMGVGVYRSLGFQEYCKINHYVWSG